MKKMFLMAMVLLGAMAANAQGDGEHGKRAMKTPEERAEMLTKRLTKKLDLTTDQQASIKAINLEAAKKTSEVQASSAAKEEKKAQILAINKDRDTKIEAQLTAEQKAKYTTLKEERKEKQLDRFKGRKSHSDSTAR